MKTLARDRAGQYAAPWLLTSLRVALAPALWAFLAAGDQGRALIVFALGCVTDALDGRIARRNGVAGRAGMYFDTAADFLFVVAGVAGFFQAGMYPGWPITVIAAMFAQFMVTSLTGRVHYDPLGRYYGAFLYGLVGMSLVAPEWSAACGPTALVWFTCACVVSRTWSALSRTCDPGGPWPRFRKFGGRSSLSRPS